MASSLTLIVSLTVAPGRHQEFETFERRASVVMARHGGHIERRIRLTPTADGPTEVHIVTFPDESAYEDYRSDEATAALAADRAAVIERSVVWIGEDAAPFAGGSAA